MNEKIATYLGFAQKARKVAGGDSAAKAAIFQGASKLLLIATDASERTAKEFQRLAEEFKIPVIVTGTKMEFGLATGQAPKSIMIVKDAGLAKAIQEAHHGERDFK